MALVCFLLSLVIHELGHILVGIANGWKFCLMVIGPLGLKRNDSDKIVFYIEKEKGLWGGVGGIIPRTINENLLNIWGKILLGGPLTSIISGIIFLSIGIILKSLFFILLGAMPIGMGIACLIPMKNGILYTDGGRWQRIHKNGQEAKEEKSLLYLIQNEQFGGDLSKIDFDYINVLSDSKDDTIKYCGLYYAYQYHKVMSLNGSPSILTL